MNFNTSLLTLPALALLSISCQAPLTSESLPSIYQGSADLNHPSVGLLVRNGKLWCTASLIGARTVLSAGHCFEGKSETPQDLQIRLAGRDYPVLRVVVHPDYSEWFGRVSADVAVLLLGEAPPVSPLPLATTPPLANEEVTMVGFGYTDALDKDSLDGTRRVGRNKVGRIESKKVFFPAPQDASSAQVCKGDSGGPIFARREGQTFQMGIVSGSTDGKAKKSCEVETYAARVDAYHSWILEQAGGDLAPLAPALPSPSDTAESNDLAEEAIPLETIENRPPQPDPGAPAEEGPELSDSPENAIPAEERPTASDLGEPGEGLSLLEVPVARKVGREG